MNRYYEDHSYCAEHEAVVTDCFREQDKIFVRLDESIFFPEEGGQHADTGVLLWDPVPEGCDNPSGQSTSAGGSIRNCGESDRPGTENGQDTGQTGEEDSPETDPSVRCDEIRCGTPDGPETEPSAAGFAHSVRVLDGEKKKNDIRYIVDAEVPAGTRVLCRISWAKRFSRMQQHTGEHILTGVIHNRYGYDNVGFHLSDDGPVTLDLNGRLTEREIMEMESAANRVVWANLPVTALYPSREELAGLSYRSKIEIDGQVRLIRIGTEDAQVDLCACCAPHVAMTGEVGLIKVVTMQNYKGGVRLGILCGERALLHYRREWSRLSGIARSLSTGVDHVAKSVASLREELAAASEQNARLTEQAVLAEIARLPENGNGVIFTETVLPNAVLRHCFTEMTARLSGTAGIFMGDDDAGYRYVAGGNGDARKIAAKMRESLGAKGGGSSEMVQGKTTAKQDEIRRFWDTL